MAALNHNEGADTDIVSIVRLSASDIDGAVDIHLRAFPQFFLSFLGPRFLREFYFSFCHDAEGIGFVGRSPDGGILGAVVGPKDPRGYFARLLKRRWWAFCLASLRALVQRPSVGPRLARALIYRGEAPEGPPRALLSSIAVDPDIQGKGVGRSLVLRWLEEVRMRGGKGCFLTTDADNNELVNAFYRDLNWRVECTYVTPEGRRMNRYVYDFDGGR